MAVQKIEYENKTYLQNDTNIPEKNKVTEANMNEIKSKVNNNADELSTAQQNIKDLQAGQGTASGDITSLKNRVTTLETDNTTNKQDISSLKSRTTTLETDNETNKTNISTLQEDVGEIESNITEIQQEQTAQNKKIEQLDDNQIHITTEKSSNINVQDASGQNGKIKLFGVSKQETRSGINLTNYEDWTGIGGNEQITEKDDDKVVCAITSSSYGVCDIERTLKPNTNYTACADFEFNGTFGNQYGLRVNANGSITSLKTDGLVNFTTDETGKARMQCYVGFPYTGADAILTVSNIRLYEGTYTRENIPDYEQYGASPTPEYPSEIENVTGDIDITVCNKNLFNNTKTISNVTYNSEEDKWIFNLPNRYDHIAQKGTFFKNIKANTNYTLYFNILKNTSSAAILFNLTNTIWNNNIQISAKQTGVVVNNIKTKEDLSTALYDLWFSHSNAITGEFEAQIMICEGSETDNNYVKYQEQLITFPLAEGQKLYDKDYPASDGIHHKRKQVELDGTEAVMDSGSNATTHHFTITFDDKKIGQHGALSNMFVNSTVATLVYSLVENSSFARITFKMPLKYTTVDSFKTFLAQQKQAGTPVVVEYELAEEEVEPYTPEQQEAYDQLQNVLSYYNVTNVFTDKALLEFKYIADTQTWVVNLVKNEVANTNKQLLEIAGGN